MEIKEAIQSVVDSKSLTQEQAYNIASGIMSGNATDAQIGALLIGLRLKGETIDEITGFVQAMREKATQIPCKNKNLVDTCGTGGDGSGTFNVSTISAIVAAGAGCNVAKHGNRSVSSQCGSADLFMKLGVNVEVKPEKVGQCIDENGIGFLFAPKLHNAMKYAIGPRREMGVRTIFNILGPMTNPAGAKRQLLGVFDVGIMESMATTLQKLGSEHVMIVHGEDGLDEITLTGKTKVYELKKGEIKKYDLNPGDVGFETISSDRLKGGDPDRNAEIAIQILEGKEGPERDFVLINAGAVIYVGGYADSIQDGIHKAKESIDSGEALKRLEKLKKMTNE
jgi:anthranilate phosphoribosyltransferase